MPKLKDPREEEELQELRAFYSLLKDISWTEVEKEWIWKGRLTLTELEHSSLRTHIAELDEIYYG